MTETKEQFRERISQYTEAQLLAEIDTLRETLKENHTAMDQELLKFKNSGNKAAGRRARKHLQMIKDVAQDIRLLIQEAKNKKK
ncbi:MAG: hypothetical protein AAF335_01455 [Bacteroidota bacterium]